MPRDAGCGRYWQDFEICERQKTTRSGHWLFSIRDARGAAVWTGDARDTRPTAGSRLAGIRHMGFMNFVPLIGAYFPSAA
jgi:hypothetical protein